MSEPRIDTALRAHLKAKFEAELEACEDGHTCAGWNEVLQEFAAGYRSELFPEGCTLSWRRADRLRRMLAEELRQAGLPVVLLHDDGAPARLLVTRDVREIEAAIEDCNRSLEAYGAKKAKLIEMRRRLEPRPLEAVYGAERQ